VKEKKSTAKTRDNRAKNWNFILYPQSAPANWREFIDETHIEWVESPLHDKDINPNGDAKKPHYHITLLFPSLKNFEQVKDITDIVNSPIPVKCQSVKGSIRVYGSQRSPRKGSI